MSVLLPTFGKPTSATSAMSFSSSRNHASSPTSPCSAKPGARRRFERKRLLPRPPCPPAAALHRSPADTRSASTSPSSVATTVPSGTGTTSVVPAGPMALLALPVGAVLGPAVRVVPEGEQRRHVPIGDEPHVPAVATVTPVGPAPGDVGLPAERHAPGAAVTTPEVHAHLVDELDTRLRPPTEVAA